MRAVHLVTLLVLAACADPHGGAMQNQSLGRATGWFAKVSPDRVLCSLHAINGTTIDLTFYLGPDTTKDLATLSLWPLSKKGQRFQQVGGFSYGSSDVAAAPVEIERGAAIVDPRFEGDAKSSAISSHTSFYFPLTVHRLRVAAGHMCNVDPLTNVVAKDDCIDVPENTGLDEAHFWCEVAVNADLKWSE